MAKIYISSTYVDLQEYRETVRCVLRRMAHEDVAMEYYVAEDKRPVDKCLEDVASCDLYVGIVAWRYGWVPDEDNPEHLSITEMEYRQAVLTNRSCLVFLLSDEAPWPLKFIDKDRGAIERFRNHLSDRHSSGPHFKTSDDLGRLIAEAIHEWEKARSLTAPDSLRSTVDFTAYRAALKNRYQRLDLDALTPPEKEEYLQLQLRSVFVEQSVRENVPPVKLTKELYEKLQREKVFQPEYFPSHVLSDALQAHETYYSKPSEPVIEVLSDPRHQKIVILGDPGSGKSTLARYILLSLADDAGDRHLSHTFNGSLPILIELRSYAGLCADNKCDSFLEYLEHIGKVEGWHLDKEGLDDYLKDEGNATVIFDGLDEIFDHGIRERITHSIVGFAAEYPKSRVVVTTRIVGYRRGILMGAGFSHFTLQDLDDQQIVDFIDRWYAIAISGYPKELGHRRDRILRAVKESAPIRQLAGNPMLLTVMAIIGKHQELPRERWKLYDYAAGVLIQHWDVNKHLKDNCVGIEYISEDDKKELLQHLAFNIQSSIGGLSGNYIHREQLQKEFENYLIKRYAQAPERAAVAARTMIEQFRERNFILSLYGANLYGYIHRALLEYFCATAFVHKFEKSREMTVDYLKQHVYGVHWEDRNWHEVLRLICGMINEQFAGEIIDYLIVEAKQPKPEEFHRRPPWNTALAVQCLSEVRNINSISETSKRVLSAVSSLFDYNVHNYEYLSFLSEQILPYAKIIGQRWPHRTILAGWLNKRRTTYLEKIYATIIGEFIGLVGKNVDEIRRVVLEFIEKKDANHRILALFAITSGWRDDPATLPLLLDRAVNDASRDMRNAAVATLIEYFHEIPQTLSLIHEMVTQDGDPDVRSAAVATLGKYFRDDHGTQPLIIDRAVNDPSQEVREAAVAALVEYFRNDGQTVSLLRESAVQDRDEDVRSAAVAALGKYFRDDPMTLPLIIDRAVNDASPLEDTEDDKYYVREVALEILGEYWKHAPEIRTLLKERAEHDPTLWLRKKARSLLMKSLFQKKTADSRPDYGVINTPLT